MKILQICHRVPYPPVDGGNIAMLNMAIALDAAGNEVHLFALNTSKHFVKPESFPKALAERLHFHSAFIETKVRAKAAMLNFFSSGSYNIERFISEEVANKLKDVLQKTTFDLVQMETLYSTGYIDLIRLYSNAKIILRAHNVEHIIWERLAAKEKKGLKKAYIRFLAGRLKKYELELLKKIDGLVPITPVDEKIFHSYGFAKPVCTIPLGIELKDYPVSSDESELALSHLGSMDWLPNIEGVKWFLDECWPEIHRRFPQLKVYLAGRNFPEELKKTDDPNVICEGRIENANDYIQQRQIMIVPLHSGSGMRVKIIQGLALARTIISTTIGAEGIEVTDGKNILIADTPAEFLMAVEKCLTDKTFCKKIAAEGRLLAEKKYSNTAIGKTLSDFYQLNYQATEAAHINR